MGMMKANTVQNLMSGDLYEILSYDKTLYRLRNIGRNVVVMVTKDDFKRKYTVHS